jgi:transcriptional regulator with XRE-family HTH domain
MERAEGRRCRRCQALLRRGNLSYHCAPCARATAREGTWARLPGDFYRRPDVVTALKEYDLGTFFKIARAVLSLTQDEFGLLIGVTQSRVCKVENGGLRLRDIATVAHIAATLATPPHLLGFVPDPTSIDSEPHDQAVSWLQRRDFIAAVTSIALGAEAMSSLHDRLSALVPDVHADPLPHVGLGDVERIEATTDAFRDWDHRWGGALCRPAIVAQLKWVITTGKKAVIASDDVRRRLLVATADLAQVAAFVHFDVEHHNEARRLWMVALDASREAGKLDLAGSVLVDLADQALHLDRPDEALRLVRLAQVTTADRDQSATDRAQSRYAGHEAWCHAATGHRQACERALGEAEEHFASVGDDDPPPWFGHWDRQAMAGLSGHVYHVLADHVPAAAGKAEPLLREAVEGGSAGFARRRTRRLIALSATYFQQGDGIGEGIHLGRQALSGVDGLKSPRTLVRLRQLDKAAARFNDQPDVPEFREELRLAITGTD